MHYIVTYMLQSKALASSFEVQGIMWVLLWSGCGYSIDASRRSCVQGNKQFFFFTDDDKRW